MWERIRTITNFKGKTPDPVNSEPALAEELNSFFARFARDN